METPVPGSVACRACSRRCAIEPGRTGFCGVRTNAEGSVALATYGKVSGCNLSPIEIKPFFHFWPGSRHLSLGSVGCNFRCAGCQNWETACPAEPQQALTADLPPGRAVRLARQVGAAGISFTYNEPTIWLEYMLDCANAAKEAGLLTSLVTNGYMTEEALEDLSRCIDAIRIDVKGTQASYDIITTDVRAEVVRRNAARCRVTGVHLEIVTNAIPGISDGEDVLRDVARWIASDLGPETPWHITRFHPARKLANLHPTRLETLERGLEIGREEGLLFAYLGNVWAHSAESTACPGCDTIVVKRQGYSVEEVRLDGGTCMTCARAIPVTGDARITEGGPLGAVPVL